MGDAVRSWVAGRIALSTIAEPPPVARGRLAWDLVVLCALAALFITAAALRREFLGDGVRHLSALWSGHPQIGEPRWLLFPSVAQLWIRLLSVNDPVKGAESVLRALVGLSVASGVLFLWSIRAWLRVDCGDESRRTAALLLAGSCAPSLILFTDIAEPQLAAAIAAAGLAYARVRREDTGHALRSLVCAVAAVAIAALIYQGVILAFGMLPLVVSRSISPRRVLLAGAVGIATVMATMIVPQVLTGTPATTAAKAVVVGEHNPLTRSMMAEQSPWKYLGAALLGPPQGIVALDNYSGLRALRSSLRATGSPLAAAAFANVILLLVGSGVTAFLFLNAVRHRQWGLIIAAAILLTLPVVRNQQYGYVKFYVLWPIPIALLALRCRARTVFTIALVVLAANSWVVGAQIRRGRDEYRHAIAAYASAAPSTCWLTSGWMPPFPYHWPGTVTPLLGTLATGNEVNAHPSALTVALHRCLCNSTSVWTDTTTRDIHVVRSIADHFGYTAIDLSAVVLDPADAAGTPMPAVLVYSPSAQQRACRFATP